MAAGIIVRLAVSAATDKNTRKIIATVCLIPIGLLLLLSFIFTYTGEDDPYIIAVNELKDEGYYNGDIKGELIRSIDLLAFGNISENTEHIKEFIAENFTLEYEVEQTDEEGNVTTTTHHRFMVFSEIVDVVTQPPFSLEKDMLDFLAVFIIGTDNGLTGGVGSLPLPCRGSITSLWGGRYHPITGEYEIHSGIDISGTWHQPIYAVADGTVVTASTIKNGYGNHVLIRHTIGGKTIYSFYAHMSKLRVLKNDSVTQGQLIGLEGGDPNNDPNPGTSTGHHLHFEIRTGTYRDTHVDPFIYLK